MMMMKMMMIMTSLVFNVVFKDSLVTCRFWFFIWNLNQQNFKLAQHFKILFVLQNYYHLFFLTILSVWFFFPLYVTCSGIESRNYFSNYMARYQYFTDQYLNMGDGNTSRNYEILFVKNSFLKNNFKIFNGNITQEMKKKIKLKAYFL